MNSVQGLLPHFSQQHLMLSDFIFAGLIDMKWYFNVVLLCCYCIMLILKNEDIKAKQS